MRDASVLHGHDRIGLVEKGALEAVAKGIAAEGEGRAAYGRQSCRMRHHRDVRIERQTGKGLC